MDERKLKILAAIVDEYIVTGEPVGSKSIMNLKSLKVSAATIRNEMAALEQMGYLEQPHTSAGRVPTFNGFRLYVDRLMSKNALSENEKQEVDNLLNFEGLSEGGIVEQASRALAEITQCAALMTNNMPKFSVISKVEVIPTGKRMYVLLLITSSGNIKNKVCRLEFDLTNEQLDFFKNYMRENLEGISLETFSDEMLEKISMAMGTYMMTLSPLVTGLVEISRDLVSSEVTLKGEKNLLTCKEFNQTEIINFIENKNEFTRLLDSSFSGLQVMFSDEADKFVINNSSIIASSYSKGGKPVGTLGVIGPMRIDYSKIIPYIEYFTQKITDFISEEEDDD